MFRVMGVFHLIGSIFQIPILCVLRLRRYVCVCVGGGGGGSKNWASSFRVILGFLVVSLQFEPADTRVLVEHPIPRCPSCTPVLFCVHVNSPSTHPHTPPPPPISTFNNTFSLAMEIFLIRYLNIFITVTSKQSFLTNTASNTIEVDIF